MNEQQKKEIAKSTILYLKNRMMINQKLISMGENQIDFEKFMSIYDKFLKRLEYIEEHPNEMIDDSNEKQISFGEKINRLKNDFVRSNADFIVLTENQIDELMGYIKESIEKYGLNSDYFYNETFFIRNVLSQLVDKMKNAKDESTNDKLKRVETFLSFALASKNVGFCKTIEGRISYRDNEFSISTHNLKPVCRINKEGINEVTSSELDDEDLLIADKMYVGSLTSDENMFCIFLEKNINGQRKMKAISYNQEIYDISGEKNHANTITTFERAILYDKINDFFEKNGFSFLTSNIYTKDLFRETIAAFNKFNNMSLEERNEIENIVEIVTLWWVDNLSSHSFDSGMKEGIDENLNLLGEMLVDSTTVSKEQEVQKFKEILGNRVRLLLLSRYSFDLMVDYRPEGELAYAIKESKVNASFPIKTHMNISKDKVEVQKGFSSPFEVIYSKDMNINLKK